MSLIPRACVRAAVIAASALVLLAGALPLGAPAPAPALAQSQAVAQAQDQPGGDTGTPGAGGASPAQGTAARAGALTGALEDNALPGPVDPAGYRLGPGDVLSLEFTGRASRQQSVVVDAEGRVNLPELGVVAVGGRTLDDVRRAILGDLRRVYPGARVDLRLVRLRTFKVYVAGEVKVPGVTRATGATRASELFEGDLALGANASRRNIELRHADGTTQRVDLDAFAYMGRAEGNPFVRDGDVLVVPPRTLHLWAYGGFARPGEFEYVPGDRVRDLVDLAGGMLPGSDAGTGMLVRFTGATALDSIPVRLDATGPQGLDLELTDRDRLFVREASDWKRTRNVTLTGEVVRPGPFSIVEGVDRLSEVLRNAGGLTREAARSRIQIFRRPPSADQRDIEFERLSRLSRTEMTDSEYQTFKTKLASQQAAFIVSYDQLVQPGSPYDVLLRDGDYIVVDREAASVRLAGQVQRPSIIQYEPGRSGRDYILLAGGYTERADQGKVRVTRAGSNQTILLSDAKEILPGDFIWVPEKKDISFWATFKDVLLVAGSVATILILLRGY